jgi:endogenous inhibitor of DNA gyrase (YacG/DUF329 family)
MSCKEYPLKSIVCINTCSICNKEYTLNNITNDIDYCSKICKNIDELNISSINIDNSQKDINYYSEYDFDEDDDYYEDYIIENTISNTYRNFVKYDFNCEVTYENKIAEKKQDDKNEKKSYYPQYDIRQDEVGMSRGVYDDENDNDVNMSKVIYKFFEVPIK